MDIEKYIAVIEDYPKKGISFKDVTSLIENGEAYAYVIDALAAWAKELGATHIVSPEARGFIFGCPVATKLGMKAEIAGSGKYDLIISLGGDGTFLSTAMKFFRKDIPIAGINLGNLGYLSTGCKDDLEQILLNILNAI